MKEQHIFDESRWKVTDCSYDIWQGDHDSDMYSEHPILRKHLVFTRILVMFINSYAFYLQEIPELDHFT